MQDQDTNCIDPWLNHVVANQTVTANNGTTHYVWDISGQIIAEVNGTTGVTQREMIYLDSMPLAAIDAVASPKKTYAVHVDHLNRPVMLTDAAKVNVWWASYEPFGRVRATGGALTQNLGLPGQWFQLESGLAYNWHRHYDPTTGRYTTADPLGFVDGPSVFAYAGNGPHRMVDPSGLVSVGGPGKNFTPRPASGVIQCLGPDAAGDPIDCARRRYEEILTCNGLSNKAARSRCYHSVERRFYECRAGSPLLPPLITW